MCVPGLLDRRGQAASESDVFCVGQSGTIFLRFLSIVRNRGRTTWSKWRTLLLEAVDHEKESPFSPPSIALHMYYIRFSKIPKSFSINSVLF